MRTFAFLILVLVGVGLVVFAYLYPGDQFVIGVIGACMAYFSWERLQDDDDK